MTRKKSLINLDKSIPLPFGFRLSITERGPRTLQWGVKALGLQASMNVNADRAKGSLGIPGTGVSFRNILTVPIPKLNDLGTTPPVEKPKPDFGHKEPMWSDDEPPTPPTGEYQGNH
tara:strand:+ start:132 stop:482 length:351 start_codon:yes stop_codon:yes gene_type:complete